VRVAGARGWGRGSSTASHHLISEVWRLHADSSARWALAVWVLCVRGKGGGGKQEEVRQCANPPCDWLPNCPPAKLIMLLLYTMTL
jgi:hypothetical protein